MMSTSSTKQAQSHQGGGGPVGCEGKTLPELAAETLRERSGRNRRRDRRVARRLEPRSSWFAAASTNSILALKMQGATAEVIARTKRPEITTQANFERVLAFYKSG